MNRERAMARAIALDHGVCTSDHTEDILEKATDAIEEARKDLLDLLDEALTFVAIVRDDGWYILSTSTAEDIADVLVDAGRLEEHETKAWVRRVRESDD